MTDKIGKPVIPYALGSVRDSVRKSVLVESVGDSARVSVWYPVRDSVGKSVKESVWASLKEDLKQIKERKLK